MANHQDVTRPVRHAPRAGPTAHDGEERVAERTAIHCGTTYAKVPGSVVSSKM